MPNLGNIFLGPLPAAGNEGIGGHKNVRSVLVSMRQPGQIPRLKSTLKGDDSLNNCGQRNAPKDDGNRLA